MPANSTTKLQEFLKTLDELKEEIYYEQKRVSGIKLETVQPISGNLERVEDALKIDLMMISQLRTDMAEYFDILQKEFKEELEEKLSTKELEVKNKLDSAISNVDKLKMNMIQEEEKIAQEIQQQLEEKYKQREQSLILKLKQKRAEDLGRFKAKMKNQEVEMKKELLSAIDNVEKLRQNITESGKDLENGIREEMSADSKERERTIIKDLETRMKSELTNLENKYMARIEILESELQRAQRKIKELRSH